jgi:hypothetical protein
MDESEIEFERWAERQPLVQFALTIADMTAPLDLDGRERIWRSVWSKATAILRL